MQNAKLRAAFAAVVLLGLNPLAAQASDVNAVAKTSKLVKEITSYGDGDDRFILLYGEIDRDMAKNVIGRLRILASKSDDPIEMHINSPGGSMPAALAIYDVMQSIKPKIKTIAMGEVDSSAVILLAAGAPGMRESYLNTEIMIHQASSTLEGKTGAMRTGMENLEHLQTSMYKILASHIGWSLDQIEDMAKMGDFYLTAEQARDMGFIDKVIAPEKTPIMARIPQMPADLCDGKIDKNRAALCKSTPPQVATIK